MSERRTGPTTAGPDTGSDTGPVPAAAAEDLDLVAEGAATSVEGPGPEASAEGAPDVADADDAGAGDGPGSDDPRSADELREALTAAEAQRDEYLDDLRRARAEFENYRRRTTREAAAARGAGKAEVAAALLEVLDDLDRTLAATDGTGDDEGVTAGVSLIADKLRRTLGTHGLERLDEVEVAFDPTVHEAVQHLPADEPTDTPQVTQVLRPGYRLDDRVLRAAMVVVTG